MGFCHATHAHVSASKITRPYAVYVIIGSGMGHFFYEKSLENLSEEIIGCK